MDEIDRWKATIRITADRTQLPVEFFEFITLDAPSLRSDALALWRKVIDVRLTFTECWHKKQLSALEREYCELASRWIEVIEKKTPPEAFFPYPPVTAEGLNVKGIDKMQMISDHPEITGIVVEVAGRLTRVMGDLSNALYQKQNEASLKASFSVTAVATVAASVAAVAAVISLVT